MTISKAKRCFHNWTRIFDSHQNGTAIRIVPESRFTSHRNADSHGPESAVWASLLESGLLLLQHPAGLAGESGEARSQAVAGRGESPRLHKRNEVERGRLGIRPAEPERSGGQP